MSYTREECAAIEARYASRRIRAHHRLAARPIKRANARQLGVAGFWALYLGAGTVDDLRAFHGLLPRPLGLLLPDMAWGSEHSQMMDTVCQLARAMFKGAFRGPIDGGRCSEQATDEARQIVARVVATVGEKVIQANAAAARRRLGPVAG